MVKKERIIDGIFTGFMVGMFLGLLFILLFLYGGSSQRLYQRIDDNKESIETIIDIVEGSILNELGTFRGVDIQLNERIEKLEGKRWYGK